MYMYIYSVCHLVRKWNVEAENLNGKIYNMKLNILVYWILVVLLRW